MQRQLATKAETFRVTAGRWLAGVCLAACSALWVAPAARAEPVLQTLAPEPAHLRDEGEFSAATLRAYQRVMAQGASEFSAGRWAEARAFFRHGHELLPNARSFRVLGMTAFNLALYPAALRELTAALADPRRPLQGLLRKQTEELRERSEALVGRYRVSLEPAGAELRVDGLITPLERDGSLLLPVGKRQLELEAPGYVPSTRALWVEGRDHGVLILHLSSPAAAAESKAAPAVLGPVAEQRDTQRSSRLRVFSDYPVSWTMGASTLALGAATGVVFERARDEQRNIEARCNGDCRPWEGVTDKRDKLERWGQGLLITSLVVAVVTTVLAVLEQERVAERRRTRVKPLRDPL